MDKIGIFYRLSNGMACHLLGDFKGDPDDFVERPDR